MSDESATVIALTRKCGVPGCDRRMGLDRVACCAPCALISATLGRPTTQHGKTCRRFTSSAPRIVR